MVEGDIELRRRQLRTQASTVHSRKRNAICVRRAYKRYGTKKNPFVILDGLNMTVPKGAIYGLLGASGCGKTTLLSCIVGRKRLNSGEIWVLGGTPGSRGSGVPGPRVGYMPQEIALFGDFSIRETLTYFGWVAGLDNRKIQLRHDFLVSFLMLPNSDRLVKNLSGGQQRRVSFAAALIHEPELLILDEPTCGVDPLLRQNIWDHLVEITKGGQTTVIITTHYIDETRQAHLIGLMRGGYLLAEESPRDLLNRFETDTLENVFLKLSVIQNLGRRRRSSIAQNVSSAVTVPTGVVNEAMVIEDVGVGDSDEISGEFGDNISLGGGHGRRVSLAPSGKEPEDIFSSVIPPEETPPAKFSDYLIKWKGNHMKALLWKNFLWTARNSAIMLFITLIPIAQIVCFCLAIGHDPRNIDVAVVDYESKNTSKCNQSMACNSSNLGCTFLEYLADDYFGLVYFDTEAEALESIKRGKTVASIVVKHNYSEAIRIRIRDWRETKPWDIKSSEIDVIRDESSKIVSDHVQYYVYNTFEIFVRDYLESCNISKEVVSLPIRWQTPIYGLHHPDFTNFSTPGIVLTVIFFLAVALTSGTMLMERNEGSLERSLVSGITGVEVLSAHVICQFLVMIIQSVIVMIFTFAVFKMTIIGSFALVTVLISMTGFCGMCYGFVVSCVTTNERMSTYLSVGTFLPMVMLCGIIWPTEAMHYLLQSVSYILPLTKATESMRSILQRGWPITEPAVYIGFISMSIWIIVFLTLSILLLKFNKG